jgi:antitoxin (DNA-binding transcriptional repressor) of toxin-antitoxin stability system
MRKTSIRELHIHTSGLVREAEKGGVIVIERRGEPVAEQRPLTSPRTISPEKKAEILRRIQKLRDQMPRMNNSPRFLEEDRNRY